jgi:uncharacterized protein YggL (DUF469 family)
MPDIPKSVLAKLRRIERHQREVDRLVSEVEEQMGLTDVFDPGDNWSFGMYVNKQGRVYSAADHEKLLRRFLELKAEGKQ